MTRSADNYEDMGVRQLLVLPFFIVSSWALASQVGVLSAQDQIPDSLVFLGNGPYYSEKAIVVDKSERTVSIWAQEDGQFLKIKSYEADFGKSAGNKQSLGDLKTPEGIYHFLGQVDQAWLNFGEYGTHPVKAYPMNYPNVFDKNEGKTGSGIWLHAVPEDTPLNRGSRGCVTVTKENIEDIRQFIQMKNTPVIVHDKVHYLSKKGNLQVKNSVIQWTKQWLNSWQNKDISSYINFYSQEFKSRGMNVKQWETYKQGLASNYQDIQISISEPRIVRFKDMWTIEFIQRYESEKYTDFGKKTLYVKGEPGNFKILAEEFEATRSRQALAQFDQSNFGCCGDTRKVSTAN